MTNTTSRKASLQALLKSIKLLFVIVLHFEKSQLKSSIITQTCNKFVKATSSKCSSIESSKSNS